MEAATPTPTTRKIEGFEDASDAMQRWAGRAEATADLAESIVSKTIVAFDVHFADYADHEVVKAIRHRLKAAEDLLSEVNGLGDPYRLGTLDQLNDAIKGREIEVINA
jgi:hypothetical protein